jgi:hypothetical protein
LEKYEPTPREKLDEEAEKDKVAKPKLSKAGQDVQNIVI